MKNDYGTGLFVFFLLPSGFFLGILFLMLLISGALSSGISGLSKKGIDFIERNKYIVILIFCLIFAAIGALRGKSEGKLSAVINAVSIAPLGTILKYAAITVLKLTGSIFTSKGDVFSTGIYFILLLPIYILLLVLLALIFVGLLMLVVMLITTVNNWAYGKNKIVFFIIAFIFTIFSSLLGIGFS